MEHNALDHPQPLRVLLVEDSVDDAELTLRALRRGGYDIEAQRIDTREAMKEALSQGEWQIVLSDHAMPRFSSLGVLEVLEEASPDIPCIIVSGAIGEEAAVELMRRGAVDYVNKGRLGLLPPAVNRALRAAAEQRARREAEEALKRAHDELERRVELRTAELVEANQKLQEEIKERQRAEEAIRHRDAILAEARLRLAEVRETERLHLARELHDAIVQQLLGISYELAATQKEIERSSDSGLGLKVRAHREMVIEVVSQLRRLISGLRPAGLQEFGFGASIENYALYLKGGVKEEPPFIKLEIDEQEGELPQDVSLCLFRAAQEALRNAVKHARAKVIVLNLRFEDQHVLLSVQDDGQGFVVPERLSILARENHFGLIGIDEHVALIKGDLSIASEPGEGTDVTVRVPLDTLREKKSAGLPPRSE
jgi:signal transduction histidine kinase